MRKIVTLVLIVVCFAVSWAVKDDFFPSRSTLTEAASSPSLQGVATSPFGSAQATAGPVNSRGGSPLSAEGQKLRQERIALASARYEQAQLTYNAYRDETRYPFTSRPIADAPDQVRPFDPVVSEGLVRNERGEPVKGVVLRLGQDRVHLSGKDAAKFTVQAVDESGKVLPLVITRATAQSVPAGTQSKQVSAALEFSDNGQNSATAVDDVARDGIFSARLSPASQGFVGFSGAIQTVIYLRVDGKEGLATIDVNYSEGTAATWGSIREAKEQGSLNFYLKADITTAGQYLVSARVDDANGKPFAILRFNDNAAVGQQEFKLQLFGLLIRDKRPAFPLKLRDVSGHLRIPDSFPDRLMMAPRPGVVHTSRSYSAESFSADEWSDEQRDRYLTEYGKDVDRTRQELEQLGIK
jgi:hypothetical protein